MTCQPAGPVIVASVETPTTASRVVLVCINAPICSVVMSWTSSQSLGMSNRDVGAGRQIPGLPSLLRFGELPGLAIHLEVILHPITAEHQVGESGLGADPRSRCGSRASL